MTSCKMSKATSPPQPALPLPAPGKELKDRLPFPATPQWGQSPPLSSLRGAALQMAPLYRHWPL